MKSVKAMIAVLAIAFFATSASAAARTMPSGKILATWMNAGDANNLYILVGTNWYRVNRTTVGTVTFDMYSAMAIAAAANGKTVGGWIGYDCGTGVQLACNSLALGNNTYTGELTNFVLFGF